MKSILFLGILCFSFSVWAQPEENTETTGTQTKNQIQSEEIFSEILKSLPSDMKAEIDSAKKSTIQTQTMMQSQEELQQQKNQSLEELPEKLRQQVEKAIENIEESRQQREIEFKEQNQRQTKGRNQK